MNKENKELDILKLADFYQEYNYNGNIAYLIINKKLEFPCMFGFVKFTDNYDDVSKLFEMIEKKALELGYNKIIGPLNYCTFMSYRWALNNYNKQYYPDCLNPSYYIDFIKKLGYKELYTYRSATINLNNPMYKIGEEILKQKINEGYVFKKFEGKEAYKLSREIYNISINAFKGSYLYCDIPYEYFKEIYLTWTKKVDVILYIAYKDEKPIGYVMGYKNLYSDEFISKTSAVMKEYQKNKIYVALLYLGSKHIKDLGYSKTIYHFQCEQKSTFKRFSKDIESDEKRYAIFVKDLL